MTQPLVEKLTVLKEIIEGSCEVIDHVNKCLLDIPEVPKDYIYALEQISKALSIASSKI